MPIESRFVAQTGVGASAPIDIKETSDIKVAYAVVVTGTVTYTVQHSVAAAVFINNTDTQNQTTTKDGNYIMPVQQVRVNVTAGTGTATLHVRQLLV